MCDFVDGLGGSSGYEGEGEECAADEKGGKGRLALEVVEGGV